MSSDRIAEATAAMIESMRCYSVAHAEGDGVSRNAFVARMFLEPAVIAAAVTAYLATLNEPQVGIPPEMHTVGTP